MTSVRTVLGDVSPDELGVCDAHDHLFFASALLGGQELDDVQAAEAELAAFGALGGRTVVQWTPFGLGRRIGDLADISRTTGIHVIAATGLHQAAHYDAGLLERATDRLTEIFIDELVLGTRADDDPDRTAGQVRAGLIKVAGGFHSLDRHARAVMRAAAEAHHSTGAPVGVHLELGTAGEDVVDLLCGELGMPPRSVILGHLNRSPDLSMYREVVAAGVYLGFDGPSRANHASDWPLADSLRALAEAGYGDQLLLGGDTTTAAARASTDGGPGMPFLLRRLRPKLERALGADLVEQIFVANPARAFAVEWHS